MDYNKGRFVPTINPLSIFSEKDARTPFEGELCVDEETNDIGFWRKNPNTNMWENISRTKDILKNLNAYEDDTTFPAARAFIADGLIHRFYYNKIDLVCWLDESVSNSEYKYYAIRSVKKINGKQRYITGDKPHDGSDYLNALTDISKRATLVFEILPNDWYTVEFYDANKSYKASINYISYPSKNMPIERNIRDTGAKKIGNNLVRDMDTRLIDVAVKFNQGNGLNSAYLYVGQSIDDLKVSVIKRMADGHTCVAEKDIAALGYVIENDSDTDKTLKEMLDSIVPEAEARTFKYWSLNKSDEATLEVLTSTVVPANGTKKFDVYAMMESINGIENRIRYDGFDKINTWHTGEYDCNVLFDYIKTDDSVSKKYKVEAYTVSVVDSNDVVIDLDGSSGSRNYVSILVQQIGTNEFVEVSDYELSNNDGVDHIVIPRDYFGFGRNIIKITYTESINQPLIQVNDLTLFIPVKVVVKEDDYFDIDKFIPAGYVTNPGRGLYYINLKYFAHYTNGRIEDITNTDRVEVISPVNKSGFGVTQAVKVRVYVDHIRRVYHDYEFTVFCTDPAISGNNSRVIINNNSNPRILFYNGSRFSLGAFGTSGSQVSVPLSSILDSSVMSFNGNKPTHIRIREIEDSTKLYTDIVDTEDSLIYASKLVIPLYISPSENKTLGEIVDSLENNTLDNFNFQYYSIDGNTAITELDRNIVCPKNTLVKFNDIFLSEVHMKNTSIFSVSKDKPFLVEGYYKDETGKYVCTGGIIHYAQSQS